MKSITVPFDMCPGSSRRQVHVRLVRHIPRVLPDRLIGGLTSLPLPFSGDSLSLLNESPLFYGV